MRAVLVEVEAEVVGHRPVAARDRAADALVADLAVVHRLLGEALLRDRRRERGRVRDQRRVAPPLERGRALRVVGPARERVGLAGGVGRRTSASASVPGLSPACAQRNSAVVDGAVLTCTGVVQLVALVGRGRVVDVRVGRVDPGRVDVARRSRSPAPGRGAPGRRRPARPAASTLWNWIPVRWPGATWPIVIADVVALVAGEVEVALDFGSKRSCAAGRVRSRAAAAPSRRRSARRARRPGRSGRSSRGSSR